MGKIPISYKAYDNGYKIPMGICLTVGGSALLSGLMSDEIGIFIIGIIGIVLFFVFKLLNYLCAEEELEENFEARIDFYKKDVEDIINNKNLNDEQKINKLINLSENGKQYATIFLRELVKRIEGEQ